MKVKFNLELTFEELFHLRRCVDSCESIDPDMLCHLSQLLDFEDQLRCEAQFYASKIKKYENVRQETT